MKINAKLIIKSALVAVLLTAIQGVSFAQEEEASGLEISGSVDAYFRTNINALNSWVIGQDIEGNDVYKTQAPATSFANGPGFSLGMANIVLSQSGEKAGFVADLVFGPRGTEAVFGSTTASSSIVNQLYGYFNLSDNVTITVGNFNTFLGYEVISPTGNFNYSTSYMFSFGPFSHSGAKADIALGDDASLMLAILNPTDLTDFNPSGSYFGGAQLGISGQYLNVLFGGEDNDFFQVDFTGGVDVSDATYVGLNATYNKDLFNGAALYLQQTVSDALALGLRGEYFGDEGVSVVGDGENIIDLTLTANVSVGNLTLIPEFRLDALSVDDTDPAAFVTDVTEVVGETGIIEMPSDATTSLASFVLAAVYSF